MSIQSKLCHIVSDISNSLQSYQRQLNNAKSAKRKQKQKIDTIENNIKLFNHQRETILEYFTDITETAFIHRYRDVDPLIRQDCISGLCEWMLTFPEYFFQSSYLRYFGWLLSDPSNMVRVEVTKCLNKLYKSDVIEDSIVAGSFRQFTERFRPQIKCMACQDSDANVRCHATMILQDLVKLGLIPGHEQINIVRDFLDLIKVNNDFGKGGSEKVKYEYSKFMHCVNLECIKSYEEKFQYEINELKNLSSFPFDECVKFRCFFDLLHDAIKLDQGQFHKFSPSDDFVPITTVFKNLYHLSFYQNSWELLLRYVTFDFSSIPIDSDNEELIRLRDSFGLTLGDDTYCVLNFILGAFLALASKKKYDEGDIDNPKTVLIKSIDYLNPVFNILMRLPTTNHIFIRIWCLLNSEYKKFGDLRGIYQNCDRIKDYKSINESLLSGYVSFDMQYFDDHCTEAYEKFLSVILLEKDPNLMVENKTSISRALDGIRSKIFSRMNTFSESDSSLPELLIGFLVEVAQVIFKVNIIGNYTEIDSLFQTYDPEDPDNVLDFLILFLRVNIKDLIDVSAHDLLSHFYKVTDSYKIIFDYFLISDASKFEKLLQTNHPNDFDIKLMFQDSIEPIKYILNSFKQFDDSVNLLNERIGSSSLLMTVHETKLLIDSINDLHTLFVVKLIDLVVSFKVFYEKFKSGNSFIRFNEFFNMPEVERYIKYSLPSSLQNRLLNIFLLKESKLAHKLKVELDRNDQESVNNTDDIEDTGDQLDSMSSNEDNSGDDEARNYRKMVEELREQQQQQQSIWNAEKDICVYSVKLFTLINLGMVDEFIEKRIKLNAKKIGGLFGKIVQQHEPEDRSGINSISKGAVTGNASDNTNTNGNINTNTNENGNDPSSEPNVNESHQPDQSTASELATTDLELNIDEVSV